MQVHTITVDRNVLLLTRWDTPTPLVDRPGPVATLTSGDRGIQFCAGAQPRVSRLHDATSSAAGRSRASA